MVTHHVFACCTSMQRQLETSNPNKKDFHFPCPAMNSTNHEWFNKSSAREDCCLHRGDSLLGSNAMFERLCFLQRWGGDRVVFDVSVCSKLSRCRLLAGLALAANQAHDVAVRRARTVRRKICHVLVLWKCKWDIYMDIMIYWYTYYQLIYSRGAIYLCFNSCLYVLPCPLRAWT